MKEFSFVLYCFIFFCLNFEHSQTDLFDHKREITDHTTHSAVCHLKTKNFDQLCSLYIDVRVYFMTTCIVSFAIVSFPSTYSTPGDHSSKNTHVSLNNKKQKLYSYIFFFYHHYAQHLFFCGSVYRSFLFILLYDIFFCVCFVVVEDPFWL